MRKIREVLRLTHELGLSVREVSKATGVGKTSVGEFVGRAKVIGITWPIPPEISDAVLEKRLFTPPGFLEGPTRQMPDWVKVNEEVKRRGVTLMELWEEYRAQVPDGYGYARYCQLYGEWKKRLSPTMRQTHVAGDKLFVDWAGHKVPIVDDMTSEVHDAHIFVAALGASSYIYSEGRWTEQLPDWIGAHVNTFDFLGGVTKAVVPDNPKVAVIKPSRYEPGINKTYQDLADHYGFVVLPARVRRPRDKAKVENAVGIVSRYLRGRLRNRRFFSLEELNVALRECVTNINAKAMKRLNKSRNELFATTNPRSRRFRPSYGYAEWKRCTVAPDYHVEATSTITQCHSGCCARRSMRATPTRRSRYSTRASALPAMCVRMFPTSIRRSRSTCPRAIAATPNGTRHA
jgi:transposase